MKYVLKKTLIFQKGFALTNRNYWENIQPNTIKPMDGGEDFDHPTEDESVRFCILKPHNWLIY